MHSEKLKAAHASQNLLRKWNIKAEYRIFLYVSSHEGLFTVEFMRRVELFVYNSSWEAVHYTYLTYASSDMYCTAAGHLVHIIVLVLSCTNSCSAWYALLLGCTSILLTRNFRCDAGWAVHILLWAVNRDIYVQQDMKHCSWAVYLLLFRMMVLLLGCTFTFVQHC